MIFFFFNDTATTEIYTLSLHDALPIYPEADQFEAVKRAFGLIAMATTSTSAPEARNLGLLRRDDRIRDRKSTRLNSSHANISYAVFCLKKKKIFTIY